MQDNYIFFIVFNTISNPWTVITYQLLQQTLIKMQLWLQISPFYNRSFKFIVKTTLTLKVLLLISPEKLNLQT